MPLEQADKWDLKHRLEDFAYQGGKIEIYPTEANYLAGLVNDDWHGKIERLERQIKFLKEKLLDNNIIVMD